MLNWIGKVLGEPSGSVAPGVPSAWAAAVDRWLEAAGKQKDANLRSGLTRDIRDYVHTGEPLGVLNELSQSPAFGEAVKLTGYQPSRLSKRAELYEKGFGAVPAPVALRWARMLEAAAAAEMGSCRLQLPNGRHWPEVLMVHSAGESFRGWSSDAKAPLLDAATLDALLVEDGMEASAMLTSAFGTTIGPWGVDVRARMVREMPGYADAVERHLQALLGLLQPTPVNQRVHVLSMLEKAHVATLQCIVGELAEHAVANSKQVRTAAEPLLRKCGDAALDPLKRLALDGKPDQRVHALRLLAQLGKESTRPDWIAFARETAAADKAPSVQALLAEWDGAAAAQTAAPPAEYQYTMPVIDWSPENNRVDAAAFDAFWRDVQARIAKENAELRRQNEQARAAGNKWPLRQVATVGDRDARALREYLESPQAQPPKREADRALAQLVWPALEALAASGKLSGVAGFKILLFFGMEAHYHDTLSHHAHALVEMLRARTGRPTLLEIAVILEAAGRSGTNLLNSYCTTWGAPLAADWPDADVWPFFARHLDLLVKMLTNHSSDYWFDRKGLYRAVGTLPSPPPELVNALFGVALGAGKSERLHAQEALRNLPGKEARIITALADGKSDARAAAATWLGRLRHAPAIPALEQAVAKEKHDVAKGALLDALQALGQPVEKYLDRGALAREAEKSLAKGVPKDVEWFPWAALPEVRWHDTRGTVPAAVLQWLLVQAVKQKTPEPNAVLRKYCGMFDPRDREALGQFVLETWLREDVRPIPPEEAMQRARSVATSTHASMSRWPEYYQDSPLLGKSVEELVAAFLPRQLRQPAGSAAGSKGLLAVAAACAAERAAAPVQRYLKEWYGSRASQGKALIAMLAWIDHPSATQVMLAVGSRFRTKSFQEEAMRQAEALAERKGWTLAELADRTVPSAGFDEDGVLELDYGHRAFTAKLLPDFKIELFNPEGKKIASLPEPRQDDDQEQAKEARKALSAAKKELKSIVDLQTDRLYEALCTGREWPFADWQAYLQQHPVLRHLIQRLVWVQVDGEARVLRGFRPMDDGTLTDREDNAVELPADARVRLAHDSLLEPAEVQAWVQHLADYEIKPLFQQLGKGTYQLPPEKAKADEIKDFEGHLLEAFALRGRSLKLGYTRGAAEDGGWFHVYQKRFPTLGMEAILEFTGSPLPEENRTVALINLSFASTAAGQPEWQRAKMPLAKVPQVLLSECYNDLRLIAAEGTGYAADWQKRSAY